MSDIPNRERGELALVVDGKRYVLTLTLAAMVEMEEVFNGRTFVQAWEGTQTTKSMRDVMLLLWTALRDKHPDLASGGPGALKKIADFVERAGGLEAVNVQLATLIKLHQRPMELDVTTTGSADGSGDGRPPGATVAPVAADSDASPGVASASTGSVAA